MVDVDSVEAVVIGGSAGAFSALKQLLRALPETLNVPVMIVVHVPPDRPSALAPLFSQDLRLRVKEVEDKEPLEAGTIYFAAPAYHLLVEDDKSLALSADDPVHFSRPSIDVLFESAADVFGERLLGVILSGASGDGAAGLRTIGVGGGVTIVQQPETAEQPLMPQAAIDARAPHAVLTPDEIAAVFGTLPAGKTRGHPTVAGRHG